MCPAGGFSDFLVSRTHSAPPHLVLAISRSFSPQLFFWFPFGFSSPRFERRDRPHSRVHRIRALCSGASGSSIQFSLCLSVPPTTTANPVPVCVRPLFSLCAYSSGRITELCPRDIKMTLVIFDTRHTQAPCSRVFSGKKNRNCRREPRISL